VSSRTTRRLPSASALAAVLALLFWAGAELPRAQSNAPELPCDINTSERVVAIGDVHGAYDPFVGMLRATGLIKGERWAGGRARLVQTGDVLDRGPDSKKVVDLLIRLEREAAAAGGRVHVLVGNHEFMRLVGDWRYVSAGEFKAFQNADSAALRDRVHARNAELASERARAEKSKFNEREYKEQFFKDFPLGYFEMQLAFGKDGTYGKWVRSRVAAVKINGVLYIHGGVSDKVANLGCQGLNAEVQRDLAAAPVPTDKITSLLSATEDGPLWYRGMADQPEDTFAPMLDSILRRLDARAVVIGHTPVPGGQITTRFGGRVVLIDTGMLGGEFYKTGAASALETRDGALAAIYADGRRVTITAPPVATR
jgi:calcineurin-like phosphoesterase family protein